jgi:tetratricopeptide (TPR) repeat protein
MADLSYLVPRLPHDTLALFEATSGMMILNVDAKTFMQSGVNYAQRSPTPEDIELYSTINHETYHYFQTLGTGYQYLFVSEIWDALVAARNARVRRDAFTQWKGRITTAAIKVFALFRFGVRLQTSDVQRLTGLHALIRNHQEISEKEKAAKGDLSILAADDPALARRLDQSWARVTARGPDDLATIDVIEGSAIVFQHLLTHGREGLEERLAKAWDETGTTYRRAFEVAQEICGARALDLLLPAAALALRYSDPARAYPVLLRQLASSEPGAEISAARELAGHAPSIGGGVRYLGTAIDVRQRQRRNKNRYQVYDEVLDKLEQRAWGFDEIDLLSDREAAQKLDAFPFLLMVRDGPLRTNNLDTQELTRRLVCGSVILRSQKLPRARREAERRLVDRAHAALAQIVDPLQAADEYNVLGLTYLNEGNLDEAEAMTKAALSIYQSHQHQQGVARQLYNLGLVYATRDDQTGAETMYEASLTISDSIGDDELIAKTSANLANQYMKSRRLDEAESLIRRAVAIEERLELKEGLALDYFNLGRIFVARQQWNQAREVVAKSVALYRQLGNERQARELEEGLEQLEQSARTGAAESQEAGSA